MLLPPTCSLISFFARGDHIVALEPILEFINNRRSGSSYTWWSYYCTTIDNNYMYLLSHHVHNILMNDQSHELKTDVSIDYLNILIKFVCLWPEYNSFSNSTLPASCQVALQWIMKWKHKQHCFGILVIVILHTWRDWQSCNTGVWPRGVANALFLRSVKSSLSPLQPQKYPDVNWVAHVRWQLVHCLLEREWPLEPQIACFFNVSGQFSWIKVLYFVISSVQVRAIHIHVYIRFSECWICFYSRSPTIWNIWLNIASHTLLKSSSKIDSQ